VAEFKGEHAYPAPDEALMSPRYSATGHPTIAQLVAEQGTEPISDVSALHGDFWPEEEPIEGFLAALHEWRGHKRTDSAA
jgi:hypothetical protein